MSRSQGNAAFLQHRAQSPEVSLRAAILLKKEEKKNKVSEGTHNLPLLVLNFTNNTSSLRAAMLLQPGDLKHLLTNSSNFCFS